MKCPNCGAEAAAGAVDCAKCAIIFAKWKKRAEPAVRLDVEETLQDAVLLAAARNRGRIRLAAAAFVAVWLAGLALYYWRSLALVAR
jgi:hypothetical protein